MDDSKLPPKTYPVMAQFARGPLLTLDVSIARISAMTRPGMVDKGIMIIDGNCIETQGGHNLLYQAWQEYLSMRQVVPLN